jgi:hypothetical protein
MAGGTAAALSEEFARTGEVRIPPRRRVTALRTLLFGLVLANEVAAIGFAASGRQSWLWWPLFCLVAAPLLAPIVWINARTTLLGQPVLVVDSAGVSLGRKHLAWQEIQSIQSSGWRRRRPADPRRPVDATLEWFASFTIVPTTNRRKRRISVGNDQIKDLHGLASWLDEMRSVMGGDEVVGPIKNPR